MCHEDAESIYHFCLNFYHKISKQHSWNGFNILQTYSGRVGALDLKFYNKKLLKKIISLKIFMMENTKFYILFDADEIDFVKFQKIPLLFIMVIMVIKLKKEQT